MNFLLVHGGMLGGWVWNKLSPYLRNKGHTVITPTLTGLGERKHLNHRNINLETHIADICNTITYENVYEIVLLGHSYAGMVITGVADRMPDRIRQVIYLDALIPKHGESMFDLVDHSIREYLCDAARNKGDGWQVPPACPTSYGFENHSDTQWVAQYSTSHPMVTFQQPLCLINGDTQLKRSYIKCTQYHALDNMFERAHELNIPAYLLDTGHFPMVTHPESLSELLIKIASL